MSKPRGARVSVQPINGPLDLSGYTRLCWGTSAFKVDCAKDYETRALLQVAGSADEQDWAAESRRAFADAVQALLMGAMPEACIVGDDDDE